MRYEKLKERLMGEHDSLERDFYWQGGSIFLEALGAIEELESRWNALAGVVNSLVGVVREMEEEHAEDD
jgi:hypothetical protein